jgi:hypothetical protein
MATSYSRGAVVKVLFPYDTNPSSPGPKPHYCLFVDEFEFNGMQYVALCYGTSKIDESLLTKHNGIIFSVSTAYIKGDAMSAPISHFIADRIAIVPRDGKWILPDFNARLDFIREQKDGIRKNLYQAFCGFERSMEFNFLQTVRYFAETKKSGMPPGKSLR